MTQPSEVIVAPDVEALIATWLPTALAGKGMPGVRVAPAIPEKRPTIFVACPQLPGGGRSNKVQESAVIAFEAWSTTDAQAKQLILLVQGLVLALAGRKLGGQQVYTVTEFNGPGLLPDPKSRQSRYVWTAEITVRASVI